MREQLNQRTRDDTEEIMTMVAGECGLLMRRFLSEPSTKEELKRLFVASQAAAIDLCEDRDDVEQHFALQLLGVLGMFDVYIDRHPEMLKEQYIQHQMASWEVIDQIKKMVAQ